MKKILIPVDSSEYSKRAVEEGVKMAKAFGSQVVLLYVANTIANYSRYEVNISAKALKDVAEGEIQFAEKMLNELKKTFGDMVDNVETVILEGYPVDEIVEYAKKSDADLLIVGSHGTGSILRRISLGSVTSKILHHINKPVLIVN